MIRLSLGITVCLALILGGASVLDPRSSVVENLNAVSGVFVALFALVAVWVELLRDRRSAEAERLQREAIDHQVGTLAFTLHRQLREWARTLAGIGTEDDRVGNIQFWGEMTEGGSDADSMRIYREMVRPVMERWRTSREAQDVAERRFQELQALAVHASPGLRESVERAFVAFYEFAGRLNRQLQAEDEEPEWREVVLGLQHLELATRKVSATVTPRLHELTNEDVALPPSILSEFASALEKELGASSEPAKAQDGN